jgi:O-antigen/teichoic acid export membrane protein
MLVLMCLFLLALYFLLDFIIGMSEPIIDKIVLCINLSLVVTAARWGEISTEFGRENDLRLLIFSSIVVIGLTDILFFDKIAPVKLILMNISVIIISFALYWYYKHKKDRKSAKTKIV